MLIKKYCQLGAVPEVNIKTVEPITINHEKSKTNGAFLIKFVPPLECSR